MDLPTIFLWTTLFWKLERMISSIEDLIVVMTYCHVKLGEHHGAVDKSNTYIFLPRSGRFCLNCRRVFKYIKLQGEDWFCTCECYLHNPPRYVEIADVLASNNNLVQFCNVLYPLIANLRRFYWFFMHKFFALYNVAWLWELDLDGAVTADMGPLPPSRDQLADQEVFVPLYSEAEMAHSLEKTGTVAVQASCFNRGLRFP